MVWFNVRLSWNELENVDLHRHIIYQNDPLTKPDFMPVFPDPYLRHRRRQGHRRLSRHHPEPQGPSYMAIINIKMILWPCFSKTDRHYIVKGWDWAHLRELHVKLTWLDFFYLVLDDMLEGDFFVLLAELPKEKSLQVTAIKTEQCFCFLKTCTSSIKEN